MTLECEDVATMNLTFGAKAFIFKILQKLHY